MAGEIEEPFSLSFRADSIRSGSISFGRFETESLSWERRSSFSHNRYLEEVEKCSKPGSVTEKKAYFEAHFKRRALLSQSSSGSQNGVESQSIENDTCENMNYREEFEQVNESDNSVQSGNNFDGSEYDRESEAIECERDDKGTSHFEPQFVPDISDGNVYEQAVPENVDSEEPQETGSENLSGIDAAPQKIEEKFNKEAVDVDLTGNAMQLLIGSHSIRKDDNASSGYQRESHAKVHVKMENKLKNSKLKSQVNATRVQRNMLNSLSMDSAKKPIKSERDGSRTTKTGKQSSHAATPIASAVRRTSKREDSKSPETKVITSSGSEKELKIKRMVEVKPSAMEIRRAHPTANSPKQTENPTKSGMKQSPAVFNFKSDIRAERRKEFYTKFEEKMHAKEAEINKMRAKKLEKTEAEIKQFRKSLNFKATPMPSFYHQTVKHGSEKSKFMSSDMKSSRPQSKPSSVKKSDPSKSSAAINCNKAASHEVTTSFQTPTNKGHPVQHEKTQDPSGRKQNHCENDGDMQKHRAPGSNSKATKGQRVEGKQRKVQVGRSRNEMVRKDMKGVGINSGMGHLAIGVAS